MFASMSRVLGWQVGIIALAVSVAAGFGGWPYGRSALIGGLVALLPNAVFAVRFGRSNKNRNAHEIVRAFYAGEAVKLALTALLFFLAFQLPNLHYAPLFAAFIAALGAFWFALLILDSGI